MEKLSAYACYNKDENVRLNSSSGAIFSILAEYIFQKKGIVYGVAMSEDCYSAEYIGITCKEDFGKLRGSKYMQAKVGDTFRQIKKHLTDGREVLFSGTGCQVNGLRYYLGKNYDNLICLDIICHGVPSPALWKKYVQYQEEKNHGKLKYVNFRCKDDSWEKFGIQEIIKKFPKNNLKQKYIPKDMDSYMQMFLNNYCLRPSCYECIAKKNKMSDLTIADFWGIESVAPEMDDGKGTSLVLIRTEKGNEIFQNIKSEVELKEVTYEAGVKGNPSEYCSVNKPVERDTFFEYMRNMRFEELEKIYNLSVKSKFKKRLKYIIRTHVLDRGAKVMQITDYYLCFLFECERKSL